MDAADYEILERWGARFDGEQWMLLAQTRLPLDEVVLVCALEQELVWRTRDQPTALELTLVETPSGPVCVFSAALRGFDGSWPASLRVLLNPLPDAGAPLLRGLSGQATTQLLFFEPESAAPLGRRVIALSEHFRAELALVSASYSESPCIERWREAVAFVDHAD